MDSNVWLSAIRFMMALVSYILYPIFVLLWGVWCLLETLVSPFMHLGLAVLYLIGAPFRFLARFEPLYVFLSWAVFIGGATGFLLYITYQSIGKALQSPNRAEETQPKVERSLLTPEVDEQTTPTSTETNRNQSFNFQWSSGKQNSRYSLSDFYTDWIDQVNSIPSKDMELISTTIVEEEDDDD